MLGYHREKIFHWRLEFLRLVVSLSLESWPGGVVAFFPLSCLLSQVGRKCPSAKTGTETIAYADTQSICMSSLGDGPRKRVSPRCLELRGIFLFLFHFTGKSIIFSHSEKRDTQTERSKRNWNSVVSTSKMCLLFCYFLYAFSESDFFLRSPYI